MKQYYEIAILASGKTFEAIRSEFRRNKWKLNNETIVLYVDLTAAKKAITKLEEEIAGISTVDTTSRSQNTIENS